MKELFSEMVSVIAKKLRDIRINQGEKGNSKYERLLIEYKTFDLYSIKHIIQNVGKRRKQKQESHK